MGKLFTNKRLMGVLDYLSKFDIVTRVYYSINVLDETMEIFNETYNQMKYLIETYKSDKFYLCYQRYPHL